MPTFIELANPVLIALLSRQVGGNSVDAGFPIIAGIMGQEETVKWQVEACERLFQEMGAGQIVHMEDERYQIALKLLRSFPTGQVVSSDMMSGITCRASVTPEQIENLYQLAENRCQKSSMGCGMLAHFSSGHMSFVFYQEVPFEEPHLDILAGMINDLQQAAVESGGSLVVEHAPAALKSRVEVWGPARDDLPIMRMLKNKFDPKGILNNCRFIGGI
jgi:FAD/FMN-containing dehydrogenase